MSFLHFDEPQTDKSNTKDFTPKPMHKQCCNTPIKLLSATAANYLCNVKSHVNRLFCNIMNRKTAIATIFIDFVKANIKAIDSHYDDALTILDSDSNTDVLRVDVFTAHFPQLSDLQKSLSWAIFT